MMRTRCAPEDVNGSWPGAQVPVLGLLRFLRFSMAAHTVSQGREVNVNGALFADGWEALVGNDPYAIEYQGDEVEILMAMTETREIVPRLSRNYVRFARWNSARTNTPRLNLSHTSSLRTRPHRGHPRPSLRPALPQGPAQCRKDARRHRLPCPRRRRPTWAGQTRPGKYKRNGSQGVGRPKGRIAEFPGRAAARSGSGAIFAAQGPVLSVGDPDGLVETLRGCFRGGSALGAETYDIEFITNSGQPGAVGGWFIGIQYR